MSPNIIGLGLVFGSVLLLFVFVVLLLWQIFRTSQTDRKLMEEVVLLQKKIDEDLSGLGKRVASIEEMLREVE